MAGVSAGAGGTSGSLANRGAWTSSHVYDHGKVAWYQRDPDDSDVSANCMAFALVPLRVLQTRASALPWEAVWALSPSRPALFSGIPPECDPSRNNTPGSGRRFRVFCFFARRLPRRPSCQFCRFVLTACVTLLPLRKFRPSFSAESTASCRFQART